MSAKDIPKFGIVIDASIAKSAGGHQSIHPVGTVCREFLFKLKVNGHRFVLGNELENEWIKHASSFALTWFTSMQNLRKTQRVDDSVAYEFHAEIDERIPEESTALQVKKDAHLVMAAMKSDSRVASMDDKIRGHFSRTFRDTAAIMSIVWVNPSIAEEKAIEWLENGAPEEHFRLLKSYPIT